MLTDQPTDQMNLRFIEAFVWVTRLHSFRAASEKLNTTQTAISARIASLESDFGVRLFERDKRTVTLTHSGEELLKYAEELLGISARMMEAVADRASYGGTISIGAIETVVYTWLPDLLRRLRDSFTKVRVEIHSYMTANLHDELLKGNIDLALTAQSLSNASVENRRICEFEMRWVTSPNTCGGDAIVGREMSGEDVSAFKCHFSLHARWSLSRLCGPCFSGAETKAVFVPETDHRVRHTSTRPGTTTICELAQTRSFFLSILGGGGRVRVAGT